MQILDTHEHIYFCFNSRFPVEHGPASRIRFSVSIRSRREILGTHGISCFMGQMSYSTKTIEALKKIQSTDTSQWLKLVLSFLHQLPEERGIAIFMPGSLQCQFQ